MAKDLRYEISDPEGVNSFIIPKQLRLEKRFVLCTSALHDKE
jgi:hypothetical protein